MEENQEAQKKERKTERVDAPAAARTVYSSHSRCQGLLLGKECQEAEGSQQVQTYLTTSCVTAGTARNPARGSFQEGCRASEKLTETSSFSPSQAKGAAHGLKCPQSHQVLSVLLCNPLGLDTLRQSVFARKATLVTSVPSTRGRSTRPSQPTVPIRRDAHQGPGPSPASPELPC